MVSIQDVVNAAYRIRENSRTVQNRSKACADSLKSHGTQLARVAEGSTTGQNAARQVADAERAVRECSAKLLTMQSDIDSFIKEITK